jgi:hypothetical protein
MEVNGQFHNPAALHQGRMPPVRIVLELGWTPEPALTLWRREKLIVPAGNRNPILRSSNPWPSRYITELFRLHVVK